jgi:hypothetical protein
MILESELRSFSCSIEDDELLAQGKIFSQQFKAGSKEAAEKAKKHVAAAAVTNITETIRLQAVFLKCVRRVEMSEQWQPQAWRKLNNPSNYVRKPHFTKN